MSQVIYIDPTSIKVKQGLDRFRQDMGDVSKLADSMKEKGQIQPIVINREQELICGGRRMAACIIAGLPAMCVYRDEVDPFKMRELELEENLHRKEFTAAEYNLAIAEIHRLRVLKYGEVTHGKKQGQSREKTAEELGISRQAVDRAIQISEMLEAFPQLKAAKKTSEIVKAAHGLGKLAQAITGMKKHEEIISSGNQPFTLINDDAVSHMCTLAPGSVDILLTDPLYGIDAHTLKQTLGGQTGRGFTSSGYKIEDCKEPAFYFYEVLAKESFRFTNTKSHGFVFVAPEHFSAVKLMFTNAGWRCYPKPMLWIKRKVGQCNVPSSWPASCYEAFIYIRRDEARLVKEGMPDWVECDPVRPELKIHEYEKPVALLYNLISRVAIPGLTLYDPFMGSGASIEAAYHFNLISIGVDIDLNAYASATKRMTRFVESKKKAEAA